MGAISFSRHRDRGRRESAILWVRICGGGGHSRQRFVSLTNLKDSGASFRQAIELIFFALSPHIKRRIPGYGNRYLTSELAV